MRKKIQRLLALAGVILLAAMYLITLYFALFDSSKGLVWFKASVVCTIVVPVLLWAYTLIYRLSRGDSEEAQEPTKENKAAPPK